MKKVFNFGKESYLKKTKSNIYIFIRKMPQWLLFTKNSFKRIKKIGKNCYKINQRGVTFPYIKIKNAF